MKSLRKLTTLAVLMIIACVGTAYAGYRIDTGNGLLTDSSTSITGTNISVNSLNVTGPGPNTLNGTTYFTNGTTYHGVFLPNGNVGIETTAPQAKLDIAGAGSAFRMYSPDGVGRNCTMANTTGIITCN